jgi:hypothetical protein
MKSKSKAPSAPSNFSRSVGGALGCYNLNVTSQQLNRGGGTGTRSTLDSATESKFGTQGSPDAAGNTGTPSAAPVAKSGK